MEYFKAKKICTIIIYDLNILLANTDILACKCVQMNNICFN